MKLALPDAPQPNGVRAFIACAMVILLGVTLLWVLAFPAPEKAYSQDIMLVLITALVTKFGTVIDWHFGSVFGGDGPKGTPTDPVSTTVENPSSAPVPVVRTPEPPPDPVVLPLDPEPTDG